jgi:hypothetical protein
VIPYLNRTNLWLWGKTCNKIVPLATTCLCKWQPKLNRNVNFYGRAYVKYVICHSRPSLDWTRVMCGFLRMWNWPFLSRQKVPTWMPKVQRLQTRVFLLKSHIQVCEGKLKQISDMQGWDSPSPLLSHCSCLSNLLKVKSASQRIR